MVASLEMVSQKSLPAQDFYYYKSVEIKKKNFFFSSFHVFRLSAQNGFYLLNLWLYNSFPVQFYTYLQWQHFFFLIVI